MATPTPQPVSSSPEGVAPTYGQTWEDFLGVATDAENLPRLRDLELSAPPIGEPASCEAGDGADLLRSNLAPFQALLKTAGLQPVLLELSLIEDRSVPSRSDHGVSGRTRPHAFYSFVASYLGAADAEALVRAYDRAILSITGDGSGASIVGHTKAYASPFLHVPPEVTGPSNDGAARTLPNEHAAYTRATSFPFSIDRTASTRDPLDIPRRLMTLLREDPATRGMAAGWLFVIFPFRRASVRRRVVDTATGLSKAVFDDGDGHNAPGGMLFVIARAASSRPLIERLQESAWRIQLLLGMTLALEARDEQRMRHRQDLSVLFHALLRPMQAAEGRAKILHDNLIAAQESGNLDLTKLVDLNGQSLAELHRLAEMGETARQAFRQPGDDLRDEFTLNKILAILDSIGKDAVSLAARLRSCNSKDAAALPVPKVTFAGGFAGGTSQYVVTSFAYLTLMVHEIVRNAVQYGAWEAASTELRCECRFVTESGADVLVVDVINPIRSESVSALKKNITSVESSLGFTQMFLLADRFGLPGPEFEINQATTPNQFAVRFRAGRIRQF